MGKIYLKKNEDRRLKNGHLWVFSNEIEVIEGDLLNGDYVEVFDVNSNFLGTGFFNRNSLIAIRVISRSQIEDVHDLFREKISDAFNLRKTFYPNRESYRLVFSESDFLPGLIIDKYNSTFVLQVNSFGMQKNIDPILDVLRAEYNARNILTKNDFYLRKLEGLPEEDYVYLGESGIELIDDSSINYKIDFSQSQKTGFYFDQNDNRFFIEKFVRDKSVADIFCNSGGFGLHALKAGAKFVHFVDSSTREIENVKENILLNDLDTNSDCFVMDAFDFLEQAINEKRNYDIVMLDPPAFAKSKKSLPSAEKGYEKLNRLALQVVGNLGYLVTSSCSYHLKKQNFLECVNRATVKSAKRLQLIQFSGASLDHPQLTAMEETQYLKFAVFKVFYVKN